VAPSSAGVTNQLAFLREDLLLCPFLRLRYYSECQSVNFNVHSERRFLTVDFFWQPNCRCGFIVGAELAREKRIVCPSCDRAHVSAVQESGMFQGVRFFCWYVICLVGDRSKV
jgi:hypothetical protein